MRRFLPAALLLLTACGQGEITCGAPPDAAGTWSYTGDQSNPAAALTGTLVLTRTGTCTLQGSASLTIDAGGGPDTRTGTAAGIFSDENTVDLTLTLEGLPSRLQMGEWHGDTISGSWTESSNSGNTGSFRMVRTGAP